MPAFTQYHQTTRRTLARWVTGLSALMALTCCSCTTMKSMARTEDFSSELQRARLQRAAALDAVIASESAGVTRIASQPRVAAKQTDFTHSEIQQVAYEEESVSCPVPGSSMCPPEPRTPVAGPDPYGIGMPLVELAQVPNPEKYCDEYLCDGGDRDWPVRYSDQERLGLDTEDTVAEYVDHNGRERLKASNKVCIYAPRFAAVRTVSQPMLGEGLNKSVGMITTTGEDELRTRLSSSQKVKRDAVGGLRTRSRASGVELEQVGAGVTQDVGLAQHDKILNLFQSFTFANRIEFDHTTAARLNYGLGAAQVWSQEANPVITGQIQSPTEGLQEVTAATLTVIDDVPSNEPGQLQIAKFADKKEAKPGDLITFTIRYHNAGPREVHYVRIVDNLTPRLEFVEGSAVLDPVREGRLATEDNGEGSLVLTFEFSETLAPKTGGTITFQARVR